MSTNRWRFIQRLRKDEEGITALETAIILIAFVVVATVFAFTILSAGTFSTERGKEAIYAGLAEVSASMEMKGDLLALSSTVGTSATIDSLVFTVGNALGGEAINLSTTDRVVHIEYRDITQRKAIDDWTMSWLVRTDSDDLLESGELVEITVPITSLATGLGVNTEFALEIKPPTGPVLNIERSTPAYIELVNDLN